MEGALDWPAILVPSGCLCGVNAALRGNARMIPQLRACFKFPPPRRVRARGLQEWAGTPAACRPGALTGRVLRQALTE